MSSHLVAGRQLSRDTEHRKAMRRNLVQSLFEHGKVRTTHPKAKEVKAFAEKLITTARLGTVTARRKVIAELQDRRVTDENQDFVLNDKGRPTTVIQRLFSEIAPRYAGRPGGYTRIIKLPTWRIGDAGSLVILELITDDQKKPTGTIRRPLGLRKKRSEKRHAFAASVIKKKSESSTGETAKPE